MRHLLTQFGKLRLKIAGTLTITRVSVDVNKCVQKTQMCHPFGERSCRQEKSNRVLRQTRFGIGRYGLLNETQGVVKHATRL